MDISPFDMFDGLSPWWWVTLALALGAAEMLTLSFFLIWPAIAALITALVLAAVPGASGEFQLGLFAGLSLGMTALARALVHGFGDGAESQNPAINRRSAQLIGRHARVIRFQAGRGTVEVDGIPWRAVSDAPIAPGAGDTVRITGSEGTLLHVSHDA